MSNSASDRPQLTRDGVPYFPGHSIALEKTQGFDLVINTSVTRFSCEFAFDLTYTTSGGRAGRLTISAATIPSRSTNSTRFALTGRPPNDRYRDVWVGGSQPDGRQRYVLGPRS